MLRAAVVELKMTSPATGEAMESRWAVVILGKRSPLEMEVKSKREEASGRVLFIPIEAPLSVMMELPTPEVEVHFTILPEVPLPDMPEVVASAILTVRMMKGEAMPPALS